MGADRLPAQARRQHEGEQPASALAQPTNTGHTRQNKARAEAGTPAHGDAHHDHHQGRSIGYSDTHEGKEPGNQPDTHADRNPDTRRGRNPGKGLDKRTAQHAGGRPGAREGCSPEPHKEHNTGKPPRQRPSAHADRRPSRPTGSHPGRHPGGPPGPPGPPGAGAHPAAGHHPHAGTHPGAGHHPHAGASPSSHSPKRRPFQVGPPLTKAERRIPLSTPAGRLQIALSAVLYLVAAGAAGGMCLLIGRAIGALVGNQNATFPLAGALAFATLSAAAEFGRVATEQRSAAAQTRYLQGRLIAHTLRLGPAQMAGQRTGALVTLITYGVEKITGYRQGYLGQMIGGLVTPLLTLTLMSLAVDAPSAGILALLVPALPLLLAVFTRITHRVSRGSRRARTQLGARYLDAIQGLETLAVTGSARRMATQLAAAGERNRVSTMRVLAANQLILFVIDAGFMLAFILTGVGLATWRAGTGAIDIGGATALVALTLLLLEPMAQIGGFFYVGMAGRAYQAQARKFLGRPTGNIALVGQRDEDEGEGDSDARTQGAPTAPAVRIRGLSFRYPGADEDVLSGLDLRVDPGQRVAIIGPSGEGKSTLVSLLVGHLTPASGTIEVARGPRPGAPAYAGAEHKAEPRTRTETSAGTGAGNALVPPIAPAVLAAPAPAAALVAQSTWLFAGTIRSNLALARPDATERQMWQALEAAHLAADVRSFPAGLDQVIGEQGLGISGGQAQRLSLARALLSGRRLLVLDEPTSQVDLHSEALIGQSLAALGRDYTIVMVTHRPSSLLGMDRVYKLTNGRLIEDAAEPRTTARRQK